MNDFDKHRKDEGLEDMARRLGDERPSATDLELDRIKVRAMSRSSRGAAPGRRRSPARPRFAGLLAALVLLAGGTGALAASGAAPFKSSSKSKSASEVEYCEQENDQGDQGNNEGNNQSQSINRNSTSQSNSQSQSSSQSNGKSVTKGSSRNNSDNGDNGNKDKNKKEKDDCDD
jgi:hypothetical protein